VSETRIELLDMEGRCSRMNGVLVGLILFDIGSAVCGEGHYDEIRKSEKGGEDKSG
jgi:hypothetical protein